MYQEVTKSKAGYAEVTNTENKPFTPITFTHFNNSTHA